MSAWAYFFRPGPELNWIKAHPTLAQEGQVVFQPDFDPFLRTQVSAAAAPACGVSVAAADFPAPAICYPLMPCVCSGVKGAVTFWHNTHRGSEEVVAGRHGAPSRHHANSTGIKVEPNWPQPKRVQLYYHQWTWHLYLGPVRFRVGCRDLMCVTRIKELREMGQFYYLCEISSW